MSTLKQGWRGADVRRLQEALNHKLQPSPGLAPDGDYGPVTRAAVLRLQAAHWLCEDGEAGPCTRNVAFDNETHAPLLHPVALIPQPVHALCWAAATAMLTRATVQTVMARTPSELMSADGALRRRVDSDRHAAGSDNGDDDNHRFAAAHGLTLRPHGPWTVAALRTALHAGPLMFDLRWGAKGGAPAGQPGHMVVLVGIRGDNDPGGGGTTLRVFDPWPPGRGARSSTSHVRWMQAVADRVCGVFQR
ncbi:peptidoglycan-binding protein [Variovorax boronicumulans]